MCSHMTCSNVSVMLSIYYSLNIYLLHPSSTLLPYTTLFRSLRALSALGVPFARQRPGRYAQQLRRALRSCDPGRKLDLRSEEHTSELQSHSDLVCRLLLEKKKTNVKTNYYYTCYVQ